MESSSDTYHNIQNPPTDSFACTNIFVLFNQPFYIFHAEIDEVKGSDNVSDNINLKAVYCNAPDAMVLEIDNMNKTGKPSSCLEPVLSSTKEYPSSPAFMHTDLSAISIADKNEGKLTGLKSYLLCNRFRVYTHFPDIAFPKCITVLPISDDKWVAVRLEFPNEESN